MINDFGQNIFYALLVELFISLIAWRIETKRTQIFVILIGTVIAGFIGFEQQIFTQTPTISPISTNAPPVIASDSSSEQNAVMDTSPAFTDSFASPEYNGIYNENLWSSHGNEAPSSIVQQGGVLKIVKENRANAATYLYARNYDEIPLKTITQNAPIFFEIKILLQSYETPGDSYINFGAIFPAGDVFMAQCHAQPKDKQIWATCWDKSWERQDETSYEVDGKNVNYDTWNTFRIEVEPDTMLFSYYLNGQLLGSHIPKDADLLKDSKIWLSFGIWTDNADTVVGYFDDVQMGLLR